MLALTLLRQLGHDAMLVLSHAGEDVTEATWSWCCVQDVRVLCGLVTTRPSHVGDSAAESMLAVAHLGATIDRQGAAVDHPGAASDHQGATIDSSGASTPLFVSMWGEVTLKITESGTT
jgi:hypothetical protein